METNIQRVPFNEKELDKLKNERNANFGCFGFGLIIFLALAGIIFLLTVNFALWSIILLIPVSFFVIYSLINSFRSGIKFRTDLREGSKSVVVAPVEGKRVKFQRNKNQGKSYRTFFLRAGGFTVRVSKTLYDEIKEGELIKFEIAPHSETIFSEPERV